jgi:predicted O-methyltransferase YrrM
VKFNQLLYSSKDWFTTIVPLRDGVAVAMRL